MQADEIRSKFLKFFENRGHKIIPSASLVPENDPSVLFNTAGMQPLIPYLMGQRHPGGNRLVNVQKCIRTQDIDEVGDKTHDTFFEMMGNWSLGDYFKEDAIKWSYEFLTSKKEGLGLDSRRLYVTCFEGDKNAPKDEESAKIWQEIFNKNNITGERIYFRPADKNWWSVGNDGPCGPDTEMFYDLTGVLTNGMTLEEYLEADDEQRVVEIWNDVFMQYIKKDGRVVGQLPSKNVDTGSGLERVVMAVQEKDNIFETDLFSSIMDEIKKLLPTINLRSQRIIADHIKTSVFIISDGVEPSNKDSGYILRRLIRRAIAHANINDITFDSQKLKSVAKIVMKIYKDTYTEFRQEDKNKEILDKLSLEARKFRATIEKGLSMIKDKTSINDKEAFDLFQTYGFPFELTKELMKEKGIEINEEGFNKMFKKHQELSRTSSVGMFKGGLADAGEETKKLHTATHLLNGALRQVLGNHVIQKGSNINAKRLRFDFTHSQKITEEEKKKVEEIVNDKIAEKLPVSFMEIPKTEAEKIAVHSFNEKYGDIVKVYFIGDEKSGYFSREFCGGPHVTNTGVLGKFKIQKEEAIAQGIRRIKAVLL